MSYFKSDVSDANFGEKGETSGFRVWARDVGSRNGSPTPMARSRCRGYNHHAPDLS